MSTFGRTRDLNERRSPLPTSMSPVSRICAFTDRYQQDRTGSVVTRRPGLPSSGCKDAETSANPPTTTRMPGANTVSYSTSGQLPSPDITQSMIVSSALAVLRIPPAVVVIGMRDDEFVDNRVIADVPASTAQSCDWRRCRHSSNPRRCHTTSTARLNG